MIVRARGLLFLLAWEFALLFAWAWLVQLCRLLVAWRARSDPARAVEYLRTLK